MRKNPKDMQKSSKRAFLRKLGVETLERREVLDSAGFPGAGIVSAELMMSATTQSGYVSQANANQAGPVVAFSPLPRSAVQINRGAILNSSINRVGEVKSFTFEAAAGDSFQLGVTPQAGLGLTVDVVGPNGVVLTQGMLVTAARFRGPLVVQQAGTYSIQVRATNGNATGAFSVGLESLASPSSDAVTIARGAVLNGRLARPIQTDQYRFNALAGETFQLGIDPSVGLLLSVDVIAPGGQPLVQRLVVGSATFRNEITTTAAGPHIIQVRALNATSVGPYGIGLESTSSPSVNAGTIQRGALLEANLLRPIHVDQFKFDASAGEVVQLGVSPTPGLRLRVDIFGPGGAAVVSGFQVSAASFLDEIRLSRTGAHVVQVRALNASSTGSYSIGLESISSPSNDAVTIPRGAVFQARIAAPTGVNQAKFEATAGERFQVGIAPVPGLVLRLDIFEPGGRALVRGLVVNQPLFRSFLTPRAGTYIIQTRALNASSLGGFSFGLESLSSPSENAFTLPRNTGINARLSAPIQVDQFKLPASAGENFTFFITPSSGLALSVAILEPGGRFVAGGRVTQSTNFSLPVSRTGTYLVRIQAINASSLGTYTLRAQLV